MADPDNGQVPVFQNTLPESVMAVLRNGPGPFWRSLCPFYKTTPARFGGRYARSAKRPHPVLAVVLAVLQNDPHPFRSSFWQYGESGCRADVGNCYGDLFSNCILFVVFGYTLASFSCRLVCERGKIELNLFELQLLLKD